MKKLDFLNENKDKIELLDKAIEENTLGLVGILIKTQNIFGYLNEYVLEYIAEELKIPVAKIYGVATFYSEFKFEKEAEVKIEVCTGTSCFLNGSDEILQAIEELYSLRPGEKTSDGKIELKEISYLGLCSESPVMSVNGKIYKNVNKDQVEEILSEYIGG